MTTPEDRGSRPSIPRSFAVVLAAAALALAGTAVTPRPVAASWEHTLSISLVSSGDLGDGTGRVTSDDGGIDCSWSNFIPSGDCSEHYVLPNFQTSYDVTLTFNPGPGTYACTNGFNGCAATGSNAALPVHFDTASGGTTTVAGSFTLTSYRVQAGPQGPGTVTSNDGADHCTPSGSATICRVFKYGTTATLTAHPDTGYPFSYWLGSPCEIDFPHTATCSFTVTKDADLTAVFGLVTLTIHHSTGGGPCEVGGDLCIESGQSALRTYRLVGTSQSFAALPEAGYAFDHWNSGPCAGKPQKCTFVLAGPTDLTASFKRLVTATPTPKPTARPSAPPTSTAAPPADPTAGAEESAAPTSAAPTTLSASAAPSAEVAATQLAGGGSSSPATPSAAAGPVSVDAGTAASSLDPLVLLLIGVVVLMTLVIGFLFGRLRATTPRSGSSR
ncbi:MAG TPA: hypothetical protein VHK64_02200 [Nocardioidaceae bacterium]|jgi:hypothetical protein|nr:hypothetical protein [Nocardioidaceae bacterium]